jgi:formylglycine-generating enzyme required for sulfatase activity
MRSADGQNVAEVNVMRAVSPLLLSLASFAQASAAMPAAMIFIRGGEFTMGSEEPMFDDARPLHRVRVGSFWIDATEVTNAEFKRFVDATGYRTAAERPLDPRKIPGVAASQLVPGSAVFSNPGRPVSLESPSHWWKYVPGASWLHPEGPASSITRRMNHPVVQVAYEDALAYAKWVGKRLPTEAEWEFAARGGLDSKEYVWGDQFRPGGRYMANTFQGRFPDANSAEDGFATTSPVRAFPPNGFGLYGVAGNAWEWVSDWYRPDYYSALAASGRVAVNPRGPDSSFDPAEPGVPKRVQKGGSFLCTDDYCARYRPGARGKGEPGSSANHIGFRLVRDR